MLAAVEAAVLTLPCRYPKLWVVDCKSVVSGASALVHLGRYLYRGVIQEKNIVACKDGRVTFRYRDSKTSRSEHRTVPGTQFLWLVLRHVLPKGFRRARIFGFLHPNCRRLPSRAKLRHPKQRASGRWRLRETQRRGRPSTQRQSRLRDQESAYPA